MSFDRTNWRMEKIVDTQVAARLAETHRAAGRRVVTTNGTFDLLHAGHLDQLEEARRQGDVLFVGVNTDEAVRAAKGPSRPFVPAAARAALLAALACVDHVVMLPGDFTEEPMRSLLRPVRPHVHVNGPDYGAPSTWREWAVMQELGISGHAVPRRNAFSTSALVREIQRSRSLP